MQQTIPNLWLLAPEGIGNGPVMNGGHRSGPWEAMEQFVKGLQNTEQESQQLRHALELVVEASAAEAACVYMDDSVVEMVGPETITPEDCLQIARALSKQAPAVGSPPFLSRLPANLANPARGAVGVLMVRLRRSRPAWILALGRNSAVPLGSSDARLIDLACRMLSDRQHQARTYGRLKDTLLGLIRCLTTAIDAKDSYTCGHSERVARIATRIGRQMDLPASDISDLYVAGLLHDVGKIGIRDDVLHKPAKLTPEEFAHIQEHTLIGDRIISEVRQLAYLRPAVRGHHERYDGQGYPDGLAGEAIPLTARILAVADACDAMLSARRYRPSLPAEEIERILKSGAGSQWDPKIVEHFMACREEIYSICQIGLGESLIAAVERAADQDDSPRRQTAHRFGSRLVETGTYVSS